jgi:hypothetical protein
MAIVAHISEASMIHSWGLEINGHNVNTARKLLRTSLYYTRCFGSLISSVINQTSGIVIPPDIHKLITYKLPLQQMICLYIQISFLDMKTLSSFKYCTIKIIVGFGLTHSLSD